MQPNISALKEDCDDGYTTSWIYQKTPRCILQIYKLWYVNYILIKLLPKKQKIMPGGPGLLEVERRAILVGTGNTADTNILASGSKNEVN